MGSKRDKRRKRQRRNEAARKQYEDVRNVENCKRTKDGQIIVVGKCGECSHRVIAHCWSEAGAKVLHGTDIALCEVCVQISFGTNWKRSELIGTNPVG